MGKYRVTVTAYECAHLADPDFMCITLKLCAKLMNAEPVNKNETIVQFS